MDTLGGRLRKRVSRLLAMFTAVVAAVGAASVVGAAPAAATPANPNLQWFGYYFGGQNMSQVAPHSNTVIYAPNNDDLTGTLSGLYWARSQGLRVIVDLGVFPFFRASDGPTAACPTPGRREFWLSQEGFVDNGSADPRQGFMPFARAVYQAGLQDTILGFYNLDEANSKCGLKWEGAAWPSWIASKWGTYPGDLAWVGRQVKATFPGKLMLVLYSTAGNMGRPLPAYHDWYGLDDYNDYSIQSNVDAYSQKFSNLAQRVRGIGKKMFIVPEAFAMNVCPSSTANQQYLVRQNNFLFNWAQTHPIVAAYLPFKWRTTQDRQGRTVCGARDLPTLQPTLRNIGNVIVASNPRVYLPAPVARWLPPPPAPGTCGVLTPNTGIGVNQYLWSCDRRFALLLQYDGNLVLYGPTGALWVAPGTWGKSNTFAMMQGDGNFVVANTSGGATWSTQTQSDGAFLVLQNDGNLVIYNTLWAPVWQSGTWGH